MSIFGKSKDERRAVVMGDVRICDDCGYDGFDYNREVDVCDRCGCNGPVHGPDECAHCGADGCMMMACPECDGRLSLDYERLQPAWDAKRGFAKFDRHARATPP